MSRSEVIPGLFVGGKPDPGRHEGVDTIVLAAIEYQPSAELFPGAEVLHAPLDDAPGRQMHDNEISIAVTAADRVARRLRAGRRVLTTCAMGLNRSGLIAALAMHSAHGMKADEIIALLRRARGPWALSNRNFESLLRVVIDERARVSTVSIATSQGPATVQVEVAATPAELKRGLMGRQHLPRDTGMLFLMGADNDWAFHMQNTPIPLDILFITHDLTVAGVISNTTPGSETLRSIGKPSRYVLEVPGGWAMAHQITAGAKVRFDGI